MRWTKQRSAWRTNFACLVCERPTVYSYLMHDLFCRDCDASLAESEWNNGKGASSTFYRWLVHRTKEHERGKDGVRR